MKVLRPPSLSQASRLLRTPRPDLRIPQRRTFVQNFLASQQIQKVSASRDLPYPTGPIYDIIADVSQYSTFLPFCKESTVTRWSKPDNLTGRQWPEEGRLVAGYGDINESFTSRVYCAPGKAVEALGGPTETTLDPRDIEHHNAFERKSEDESLLSHLLTRWTVYRTTSPQDGSAIEGKKYTHVDLRIEFQFKNPLYGALSAAASPKVAEVMVKAFEKRVKEVLGEP